MKHSATARNRCHTPHLVTGVAICLAALTFGLAPPAMGESAPEPPLSPRMPLIDATTRAEADGYARVDRLVRRSAAVPDVFDPAVCADKATAEHLRSSLLEHSLWIETQQAAHLEMIESLPGRLAQVPTREPYREDLISLYAKASPERSRRVEAIYREEISAAEIRVAFLDQVIGGAVQPKPSGFVFAGEADAARYRQTIAALNQAFANQDRLIAEYYAWEIEQKAALRQFRSQL